MTGVLFAIEKHNIQKERLLHSENTMYQVLGNFVDAVG